MTGELSSQQQLEILSALPDPAFILTRSGVYAAVYGGSDKRYYHDGSMLVGQTLHTVLRKDKADWFLDHIERALGDRRLHVVEYPLAAADVNGLDDEGPDEPLWFEGRIQALDFQVDNEDAVLWVASNITARHHMQERLRWQSETDPLTGLYNRRRLMQELQSSFALYERYGTFATLLLFDIDHFKRINDGLGHQGGDQVIETVADICRQQLRNTDLAARMGGDEFMILLPQTRVEDAALIAERIRQRVEQHVLGLGVDMAGCSVSGGLAEYHGVDGSFEDTIKRADDALYRAKTSGRNQILEG